MNKGEDLFMEIVIRRGREAPWTFRMQSHVSATTSHRSPCSADGLRSRRKGCSRRRLINSLAHKEPAGE